MTAYQILCILGIPTCVVGMLKFVFNHIKGIKLGVQALLRAEMINSYNKHSDLGYAPIYARENFENCWRQYHSLGANGVMDDIRDKFMRLPIEQKKGCDASEGR